MSFGNLYFMWVCEASEENIWTVFTVRLNGPKNKNVASSRSDHSGPTKMEFLHLALPWADKSKKFN